MLNISFLACPEKVRLVCIAVNWATFKDLPYLTMPNIKSA